MCASALHPACRSLSSCCRMLVHLKRWVLGLQTLMVGAARCCQRKGSNQVRDAFFSTACANKACAACDYYLFISLHPPPHSYTPKAHTKSGSKCRRTSTLLGETRSIHSAKSPLLSRIRRSISTSLCSCRSNVN